MEKLAEWEALEKCASEIMKEGRLCEFLADVQRCNSMTAEFEDIFLDYSRELLTQKAKDLLLEIAEKADVYQKIERMFSGEHINSTEDRAVFHVALRAPEDAVMLDMGVNVVPDVHKVLKQIEEFSEKVRTGKHRGHTGKTLKNTIVIGIGGSFLGPLFVHNALKTSKDGIAKAEGRELRFLANVDPIDVKLSLQGLNAEETLVIIVSKTFTTAETMLNARTVREWVKTHLGEDAIASHMVAVSSNEALVQSFGISPSHIFTFWDWVGGRYSVSSAVGILPLSVQYGFDTSRKFLEGMRSVDQHFRNSKTLGWSCLPLALGLINVWNVSFLNFGSRAILPYCQALDRFVHHIQQLTMESNGKSVDVNGHPLAYTTGQLDFGEPGTNGQHSFYQLLHQGRVVPCEFIGIVESQCPVELEGEVVSNHDELMSNFFAQPDALAYGKSKKELSDESVPEHLHGHKEFSGNRPSLSLLFPCLDAYRIGQLLCLYEHSTAVSGFVWNINSFDQWGVELGKTLAKKVRAQLQQARAGSEVKDFNHSTKRLLERYLEKSV